MPQQHSCELLPASRISAAITGDMCFGQRLLSAPRVLEDITGAACCSGLYRRHVFQRPLPALCVSAAITGAMCFRGALPAPRVSAAIAGAMCISGYWPPILAPCVSKGHYRRHDKSHPSKHKTFV